jgi:alcohol dehydrogenase
MLDLQRLWIQNINISMGLVNTTTLGMLLKLVAQQKLPVDKFVTHRFAMDDIVAAYETFGNAAETQALKVLISRG